MRIFCWIGMHGWPVYVQAHSQAPRVVRCERCGKPRKPRKSHPGSL